MKYLNRLKFEKGLSGELQKLQKAPFYSFCSSEGRHFPENAPPMSRPYLDQSGDLVIPFGSDPRYHWWKGEQSIVETTSELKGVVDA